MTAAPLDAQTVIKPPKNKFTPQQDVQLGKEAADEVRKQYPVITDEHIQQYLTRLGDRLVAAAPTDLKQSVYEYSFTPVNLKEINAFALPGGPMFVNRGMFGAAAAEAEVVGVMAHELSHVLLRHGTANATKASNPWLQIGQLAGQVGGAMMGGQLGGLIAQGSEFGVVFVVLPRRTRLLTRELVYTALTRAQKHLVLLIEGRDPSHHPPAWSQWRHRPRV